MVLCDSVAAGAVLVREGFPSGVIGSETGGTSAVV